MSLPNTTGHQIKNPVAGKVVGQWNAIDAHALQIPQVTGTAAGILQNIAKDTVHLSHRAWKKSHWYLPDSFIPAGAENATSVIYHQG